MNGRKAKELRKMVAASKVKPEDQRRSYRRIKKLYTRGVV